MTTGALPGFALMILLILPSACTAPSSDSAKETGDDIYEEPQLVVTMELTMDSDPPMAGAEWIFEFETPDAADCVGGVTLFTDQSYGFHPPESLGFVNRTPGTASTVIGDYWDLYWDPNDPESPLPVIVWSGTYVIATWEDALIELSLIDGTRCDYPGDSNCSPSSGTLTMTGERGEPFEDTAKVGDYQDVATGDTICFDIYD